MVRGANRKRRGEGGRGMGLNSKGDSKEKGVRKGRDK